MIRQLENKSSFKDANKVLWDYNSDFWFNQYYRHFGVKEFLRDRISFIIDEQKIQLPKIIDAGCGSGWLCDEVLSLSTDCHYIGIDYCTKFISYLEAKYKGNNRVNLKYLDIDEKYTENEINSEFQSDIIVACLSLIETPNLEEAFINLNRMLKDEGRLIIIGLNPIVELFRDSESGDEFYENFIRYRTAENLMYIEKRLSFNSIIAPKEYYRILYSLDDYCQAASITGLNITEARTELNKRNSLVSPVYQFLEFKKN